MPAKDFFHDTVRHALVKDGWIVTHDPLVLKWGKKDFFADLGAERLVAAIKGSEKIAVEIKSFAGPSEMADLEKAVGQYVIHHDILAQTEPDRRLYLAVPLFVMGDVFEEAIGRLLLVNNRLRLIVFDAEEEVIRQWIP